MSRRRHIRGPRIGLWRWLKPRRVTEGPSLSWDQLRGRRTFLTYRGRTAISLACHALGIGHRHEVLVPSYNCGTELDAILSSGAAVVGYRVTQDCRIDIDDLASRRTTRTRAVYLIHYFGWEQPVRNLRQWCDLHGLFLIEDCALALFSSGETDPIGLTGDASIFSLPKTLGLVHGGILALAADPVARLPELLPPPPGTLSSELQHAARELVLSLASSVGADRVLLRLRGTPGRARSPMGDLQVRPEMPSAYYFDPPLDSGRAIHPRAWALASGYDPRPIVAARRSHYLRVAETMREMRGVQLLFETLPPGVCPLSLPVLTRGRDARVRDFNARGIDALPWWAGYHRGPLDWDAFPDACSLKDNLLTLPIHHDLNEAQLRYLIACAIDVFDQAPEP